MSSSFKKYNCFQIKFNNEREAFNMRIEESLHKREGNPNVRPEQGASFI